MNDGSRCGIHCWKSYFSLGNEMNRRRDVAAVHSNENIAFNINELSMLEASRVLLWPTPFAAAPLLFLSRDHVGRHLSTKIIDARQTIIERTSFVRLN